MNRSYMHRVVSYFGNLPKRSFKKTQIKFRGAANSVAVAFSVLRPLTMDAATAHGLWIHVKNMLGVMMGLPMPPIKYLGRTAPLLTFFHKYLAGWKTGKNDVSCSIVKPILMKRAKPLRRLIYVIFGPIAFRAGALGVSLAAKRSLHLGHDLKTLWTLRLLLAVTSGAWPCDVLRWFSPRTEPYRPRPNASNAGGNPAYHFWHFQYGSFKTLNNDINVQSSNGQHCYCLIP